MGRRSLTGSSAADNLSALFRDLNHHQNHQGHSQQTTHHSNGIDHDKPTYAMDHLATFKVKHESELRNPIEKIKLLKDTNVCPQKMFMRFNGQWIVILDQDEVEIESFPGSLIHEPAALVSKDPLEEFNNMLVFSVSGSALGNTEMHVFQVEDASAIHLVEDLKLVRNGQIITQRRDRIENHKPKQTANGDIIDQYGIREAMIKSRDNNEDTKERDINVLNHCFEDIEKFIFRLHYAAEALGELQNRKLKNKLNSNPHGEGLLVLRSRPPVENEFIDILAKFKLAFNFLTRLQAHIDKKKFSINDIFVSLETIVVTCNDVYVNAGIPQSVVNPILRRETISYLESCVTPKQRDFWQSLGKNWNLPKDSFKDHKGAYHPIFFDDWSPDFIVDEPVAYIPPPIIKTEENNLMHDITNATWHRKLKSRNVKIAEVTHPRTASTDKELSVVKGEFLEIIEDSRNWWKARNNRGQIGFVPNTILNPHNFEVSEISTYLGEVSDTESLPSSMNDQSSMKESGKSGRTSLYAYEIEREMPKQVLPRRSFSEPLPPPPPPPPPGGDTPPITPVNTFQKELALAGALVAMRARNDCDTENLESQDEIQEQLRQSMLSREKRRDLEILKTPQIFIEASSTSKEVEEWLRKKGFSNEVIKKLHGLNGNELFALPDETVDGYFCKEDSKRLKSQVLLQKKFSGFKTTRSNELQAILARRRQKADATIPEEAEED